MAFPTIPATGSGTLAGLNQLNTTATLTGPNLNTLSFAPGDMLIACAGEYQSNAGTLAAYTGWAGGGLSWTEITDSTGTAVNRLGVAVARAVTGSETGTVTVTRSGTLVGDASMIILVVSGAHSTSNPEVTAMATGTTTAANPASLSPSWGAEDTLWIGLNGNGMTSGTGSWTANNGAPTNYTGYYGTNPADTSTVGDFGLAVAFRQNNAASEDMAAFSQDTSNARSSAFCIAVRPAPAVPEDSPALELKDFGTFTGVGSGDTINKVTVAVTHSEAVAGAPTVQLWDGVTAQIGTDQTCTTSASLHTDSFDFTGVTYSQLSTLRVRFLAHETVGLATHLDAVGLTVNYTSVGGVSGDAAFTGTATLTAAGNKAAFGAAASTGTATLAATGKVGKSTGAAFTGTATVAATGKVGKSTGSPSPGQRRSQLPARSGSRLARRSPGPPLSQRQARSVKAPAQPSPGQRRSPRPA